MWRAGAVGGPVYTTASVACDRAGAAMNKPLANAENAENAKAGPTNRPTDQKTDQPTDTVTY